MLVLIRQIRFCLDCSKIANRHFSAIYLDQPFSLQAAEVARNQFAYGTNLRSNLLIIVRQCDRDAAARLHAFTISKTNEKGRQAVPYSRKREFLDDSDQPSQSGTHHSQHFESYLGMSQTQLLKILLANK